MHTSSCWSMLSLGDSMLSAEMSITSLRWFRCSSDYKIRLNTTMYPSSRQSMSNFHWNFIITKYSKIVLTNWDTTTLETLRQHCFGRSLLARGILVVWTVLPQGTLQTDRWYEHRHTHYPSKQYLKSLARIHPPELHQGNDLRNFNTLAR